MDIVAAREGSVTHLLRLWHEATNGTSEVTPESLERFARAIERETRETMDTGTPEK